MNKRTLGFGSQTGANVEYEKMREGMLEELKKTFRPEFLNRLDEMIVFHQLGQQDIEQITGLMLDAVCKRLEEKNVFLTVSPAAAQLLAKEGFDPLYGARPLRRAVQRIVEDRLSEELLAGNIRLGDKVLLDVKDDAICFTPLRETDCAPQNTEQTADAVQPQPEKA